MGRRNNFFCESKKVIYTRGKLQNWESHGSCRVTESKVGENWARLYRRRRRKGKYYFSYWPKGDMGGTEDRDRVLVGKRGSCN